MAWVRINGHRYYRRSKRAGGKVVTEHVGGGPVGEACARLDASERALRRLDRAAARLDRDAFVIGIQDALAVDEALGNLFALLAERCGAYRHRRQWRLKRRADVMGSLRGMINAVKRLAAEVERAQAARPLMAPEFDGIPDDDRATLQAAAKGDAAALERARPYLTDRRYRNRKPHSAWFRVLAATRSATAGWARNALTSGSPMASGWRTLWNRMNRLHQSWYASSVRGE